MAMELTQCLDATNSGAAAAAVLRARFHALGGVRRELALQLAIDRRDRLLVLAAPTYAIK